MVLKDQNRMITQEYLKSVLDYDRDAGLFTRLESYKTVRKGDIAGGVNKRGYVCIRVKSKKYLAHRLAWLYEYGVLPNTSIDHINGITTDNRIANLRLVSYSGNNENRRRARKDSSSKLLGISIKRQGNKIKWQARIQVNNIRTYLGIFDTEEEAYAIYLNAKRKYHKFNTL